MSRTLTITEALAELKTLDKRITKKRAAIGSYIMRSNTQVDPLVASGGSPKYVAEELQAISDLEENTINIRFEIAQANATHEITIGGEMRSITGWLSWRRDVAPKRQQFLSTLAAGIDQQRRKALTQGLQVVSAERGAEKLNDVVVNLDEKKLQQEIEHIEEVLGTLDGQLSLKNATLTITL